ncbi:MAG TPA: tRNA (N6-threonylcarbamoyladenosine(37)-N6)-methyltransferase TrmO [Bryobacteraceae bacterium]|nr:tRNA (N6-threonylcarbamoyladenosine(37)-N6)-methyltransferase TrmO [Bryobacteraceae bacterium]
MSQKISARWRLTALPSMAAAALPASGGEVMSTLTIEPIGHIESPFLEPAGTPIQPSRAEGARGRVLLREKYLDGLKDLEGFERIWLVYWLHKASPGRLTVTPFLDQTPRGIFATRSPARPSPLGMSAVRLTGIRDGALEIADVDVINGTPLLDIKPYVPEFDSFPGSRAGWFDQSRSGRRKADGRFVHDTPGAPGKP